MPNIKSAKKRVRQNEVRNERNKALRTFMKNLHKKTIVAISGEESKKESALQALNHYKSQVDKAWSKGIYKRNKASRLVSKMDNFYKSYFEKQASTEES